MSIADELRQVIHAALPACTELQQAAYRLVEGITEDGEVTEPTTLKDAAARLGCDRGNLIHSLNAARVEVLTACCAHLYQRIRESEDDDPATLVDAVGSSTVDPADIRIGYRITTLGAPSPARNRIVLGEGSTAMTLAAKRSTPEERRSATIDAHVRYADRGRKA